MAGVHEEEDLVRAIDSIQLFLLRYARRDGPALALHHRPVHPERDERRRERPMAILCDKTRRGSRYTSHVTIAAPTAQADVPKTRQLRQSSAFVAFALVRGA